MRAKNFSFLRTTGLLGGTALSLLTITTAISAAPTDELPKFESYIKVTGHAASISGNDAAYQKRIRSLLDYFFGLSL